AEIVDALHRTVGVRVRKAESPANALRRLAPVRPVELHGERVVPGLPVVGRVDEVAEPVRPEVEALAARAVRVQGEVCPVQGELIESALAVVAQRERPVPNHMAY